MNSKTANLTRWRYFVAAAEELSFSRAAERCHVAQPSLSRQIGALEDYLGVALFNRDKRQISLTEAGQVFLRDARRVLAQSAWAVQNVRRAGRDEANRLALGFVEYADFPFLPWLIQRLRDRYPLTEVTYVHLPSQAQAEALKQGIIDVGFCGVNEDLERDPSLVYAPLVSAKWVMALPEDHPLSTRPDLQLADFADTSFVLFPRQISPPKYDKILSLCQQAGFIPSIIHEAQQQRFGLSLVSAGTGVMPVIDYGEPAPLGVVLKDIFSETLFYEVSAVWRQSDTSPQVRHLVGAAKEYSELK